VLEDVAAQGHPWPRKCWNGGLAKLRGTYTDALPTYINARPAGAYLLRHGLHLNRRLASTDPNLQTFPFGPKKAAASVRPSCPRDQADQCGLQPDRASAAGHIADSRIEKAFADNLTFMHDRVGNFRRADQGHARRCAPQSQGDQFRIVYVFPLSAWPTSWYPPKRSHDYIKKYFTRFPASATIGRHQAIRPHHGFVETLFGRRIHIRNQFQVPASARAERAAINAPIQGPPRHPPRHGQAAGRAADAKIKATMLLQVHDELTSRPRQGSREGVKADQVGNGKKRRCGVEISVPLWWKRVRR